MGRACATCWNWLNNAVASTALDAPVEFMFASRKPNLFEKLMSQWSEGESREEELLQKLAKAYERMKNKANRGKHRKKQGGNPTCV